MKTLHELNEAVQQKISILDKVLMVMDSADLEMESKKNQKTRKKKQKKSEPFNGALYYYWSNAPIMHYP